MKVKFSPLRQQYANPAEFINKITAIAMRGDFTLGGALGVFEKEFAAMVGFQHAIGVNSGTDALKLSLKWAGVGPGDHVIVPAQTFVASVGAIVELDAKPILVDTGLDFTINADQIEKVIGPCTKAIMPVHLTGQWADMERIRDLADAYKLKVVADTAQALMPWTDQQAPTAQCYSFHPLKNLNVWGDGGMITTDDDDMAQWLLKYRNHGLSDRNTVEFFGCNSRLDTIQAAIGLLQLPDLGKTIKRRQEIAARYDDALHESSGRVLVPPRSRAHAYHLYMVRAKNRNGLLLRLQDKGVEAKVHYPVPLFMQPAMMKDMGVDPSRFPRAAADANEVISLPIHQYLEDAEVEYVIDKIKEFYR